MARTTKDAQDREARLWQRYESSRSIEDRNALVEHFLPWARACAQGWTRRLRMEADEILSGACEGLMQAVEKFDRSRGLAFSTYAMRRMYGAVLDTARKLDWVPREIRAAIAAGRAEERHMDSLDAVQSHPDIDDSRPLRLGDVLPGREGPVEERREAVEAAAEIVAWKGLAPAERELLLRYYAEEEPMIEIGRQWRGPRLSRRAGSQRQAGYSEARISQCHTMIVERIRREWRPGAADPGALAEAERRFHAAGIPQPGKQERAAMQEAATQPRISVFDAIGVMAAAGRAQLDELRVRIDELEKLLADYRSFEAFLRERVSRPAAATTPAPGRKPAKMKLGDLVLEAVKQAGRPLRCSEVIAALAAEGHDVTSANIGRAVGHHAELVLEHGVVHQRGAALREVA